MGEPCSSARLSEVALERLEAARVESEALVALGALATMLDAEDRGRWHVAGAIADRLRRFESGPWQRIARRGREPQSAVERALAAICRSGLPRTRMRIYKLLA